MIWLQKRQQGWRLIISHNNAVLMKALVVVLVRTSYAIFRNCNSSGLTAQLFRGLTQRPAKPPPSRCYELSIFGTASRSFRKRKKLRLHLLAENVSAS